MEKVILHSDLNAFYASVECLYRPDLRDKPVAVAGNVEDRHGIILTKNQIAKKFEIKTGEAIWQAQQKCPELVVLPPRIIKLSPTKVERYKATLDRCVAKCLNRVNVANGVSTFFGEKIAVSIALPLCF